MKRKVVLIVEDDKEFLDELAQALAWSGYVPVAISKSIWAFDAARKVRPDVILLDLKMEKMSGFQVARKLRACPETAGIPIVPMSGHFNEENATRLFHLDGIKTFLNKPFSQREVLTKLETVLAEDRGAVK